MASRLIVYIPSFENFSGALSQVRSLSAQWQSLDRSLWQYLDILVSVNGCSYDRNLLESLGARVIQRHTNLGADVNIALGFLEAGIDDYLWILSDNDAVSHSALASIAQAFMQDRVVDLVVGVTDKSLEGFQTLRSPVTQNGGSFHVGLISAVVYRWSSFIESTPAAFQSLWSGWGHIALQEHAVRTQSTITVVCLPLDSIASLSRGDQTERSVARARQAYTHSFYGGGMLDFLGAELAGEDGRRNLSRWWRRHWLYASAYRPRKYWRTRNYRAHIVEALIRTGRPRDRILWFLSLLPYWRVGLWLRRRGFRSRLWT